MSVKRIIKGVMIGAFLITASVAKAETAGKLATCYNTNYSKCMLEVDNQTACKRYTLLLCTKKIDKPIFNKLMEGLKDEKRK